jgi:hypothetical protein
MTSRASEAPASASDLGSPLRRRRAPRTRSPQPAASASSSSGMANGTRRCTLCGLEARDAAGTSDLMMTCDTCASLFHAKCANLPAPPETGSVFCRHACYSAFLARRQQQEGGKARRPRSDNFPDLVAGIQRILQQQPGAAQAPPAPQPEEQPRGRSNQDDPQRPSSDRKRIDRGGTDGTNGGSNGAKYNSERRYTGGARGPGSASTSSAPGRSDSSFGASNAGPMPLSADADSFVRDGSDTGPTPRSRSSSSSGSRDIRRESRPTAVPARQEFRNEIPLPSMSSSLSAPLSTQPPGRRGLSTSTQPPARDFAPREQTSALPTLFNRRNPQVPQPMTTEQQPAFDLRGRSYDPTTRSRRVDGGGIMEPAYQGVQRGKIMLSQIALPLKVVELTDCVMPSTSLC